MFYVLITILVQAWSVYSAVISPRQSAAQQLCQTIEGSSGPADCSTACQGAYQVLAQIAQQNAAPTTSLITEICDTNSTPGADIALCAICFASGVGDNNNPWANSVTASSDQTFGGFLILTGICAAYDQGGAAAGLQVAESNEQFPTVPSFYDICTPVNSGPPAQSTTTPAPAMSSSMSSAMPSPAKSSNTPSPFPIVPASSSASMAPVPASSSSKAGAVPTAAANFPAFGFSGLGVVAGLLALA